MQNILDNTLFFTHGGRISGLYGLLSSHKLSSFNALVREGDNVLKFTDAQNKFNAENNFLFFESIADRGRINYSSFTDKGSNHAGFDFLVVASSQSLLNQVDMLGDSDGVLIGRTDGQPLEIDMTQVHYKILVPESYKEDVEAYCQHLRELGFQPPEDLIVFKSISELNRLVEYQPEKNITDRQIELCKKIDLNAKKTNKLFSNNNKIIETKTSKIITVCDDALPVLSEEQIQPRSFNSAKDLLNHMLERPTPSNIQRNTLLLFGEKTNRTINSLPQDKPLILDLISDSKNLAFCLNSLTQFHPDKELNSNNENRISSYAINSIIHKLKNIDFHSETLNGLIECLQFVKDKDITSEECLSIFESNQIPDPSDDSEPSQNLIQSDSIDNIIKNIACIRKQYQKKQDTYTPKS